MANGQFQYVLFDWDGCLADTLSIWMEAYVGVFASYGLRPSRAVIAEKVFGNLLGHRAVGVTDDEGFRIKLASAVDMGLRHAPLHKNVRQVLDELRLRRKTMAVISSSDKAVVGDAMQHNGVSAYFSSVLCKEDVTRH